MRLEQAITYVGGNYGPSTGQLLNIILRSILHFAAVVSCLVPMQLFCRSGELAGATLVISGAIMNLYHLTNTLTWHNDDVANWPRAYGWCDIQLASAVPLETLVAATTCTILRNVANQISSLRATTLTGNEKRRKNLIHALIIFPVPLLQASLYFFVIGMRYNISGIIGCQAIFQTNWVFVVFFLLPCPTFALCAGYYAVFTWRKYRQIDAESRENLWNSRNSGAQTRNAKARRKLYFMTLTILTPWLPMQLVFLYNNLSMGMPWAGSIDLPSVHPEGWNQIDYAPISTVPWSHMYGTYAYAFEGLIVFLYFGLTKDAHDLYLLPIRQTTRKLERHVVSRKESFFYFLFVNSEFTKASKTRQVDSFAPKLTLHASSHGCPSSKKASLSASQVDEVDNVQPLNIRLNSLDLKAARATTEAFRSSERVPQLPPRNPWVFRTMPASPFSVGIMFGGNKCKAAGNSSNQDSLRPVIHPLHTSQAPSVMGKYHPGPSPNDTRSAGWSSIPRDGRVQTKVWAADRRGTSAVDGASSLDKEMGESGVRVEKHISSSSEVSPPRPAYR